MIYLVRHCRAAGQEPLALRMSLLGQNPRLARCFQAAAQIAQWDGGGPGSAMGIAGAGNSGSLIATLCAPRLAERFGLEHSTLQVEHATGPVQLGPSFRRKSPLHR